MKLIKKKITTNTRVLNETLTQYRDTFHAFKELINNSIQADASLIKIELSYNKKFDSHSPLTEIKIWDNGHGVSYSEFDEKILEIGTTSKNSGQGIGRFGALQIGLTMEIETVGFDQSEEKYSLTVFNLDSRELKDVGLDKKEFNIKLDYLDGSEVNTYYQVIISNLHHNSQEKVRTRNRLSTLFLKENIHQAIFENYPLEIFHDKIKFFVNGDVLKKSDFVVEKPSKKSLIHKDNFGKDHEVNLYFYQIKSKLNKVKVFFQIDNAGLKSVAHEFTYSSDWYTPDLGTWFIYVDSKIFNNDLFRNLDMDTLGHEEVKKIKDSIKNGMNEFFKLKNEKFKKFIDTLEKDDYYPYREKYPTSKTQASVFNKVAYALEDEHKLLEKKVKIRNIIYPLLDRAISNGNIEFILEKVLKMSDEAIFKFKSLLQKTELEDVIHFSSVVSEKIEFLDFLHDLNYGDISGFVKERSQLHKIVENNLWVFGENYNGTPHLWSDKRLDKILLDLRKRFFSYDPTEEDENLIEDSGLEDITDLFFFNEKVNDNDDKEIMIVELKSPKCAISEKELSQIDRYAFTIVSNPSFPTENVKYKLVLISSKMTAYAKSKVNSARLKFPNTPFMYDLKTEKNVEVYVLTWSDLIEQNKRKLGYLSNKLEIKDKSVRDKFEEEYPHLIDEKVSAQLRKVASY